MSMVWEIKDTSKMSIEKRRCMYLCGSKSSSGLRTSSVKVESLMGGSCFLLIHSVGGVVKIQDKWESLHGHRHSNLSVSVALNDSEWASIARFFRFKYHIRRTCELLRRTKKRSHSASIFNLLTSSRPSGTEAGI